MSTSMTLEIAAAQYFEHLKAKGKSGRMIYTYSRDLQQVLAFFGPDRLIDNLPLPLMGRFLKSDELLKLPD